MLFGQPHFCAFRPLDRRNLDGARGEREGGEDKRHNERGEDVSRRAHHGRASAVAGDSQPVTDMRGTR